MIKDCSGFKVKWTRHALAEALEDGFSARDVETSLNLVAECPEFDSEKKRGTLIVGQRFCTLVYVTSPFGLRIITCWESNRTDVEGYNTALRQRRRLHG